MAVKNTINTNATSQRLRSRAVFHLNSAAQSMVTIRKELAPKDTGWMAERTRIEEHATEDSLRAVVLCDSSNNPDRGGDNEAYDEMVEFGTVDSPAQPSAIPAFESAKKQLNNVRGIF